MFRKLLDIVSKYMGILRFMRSEGGANVNHETCKETIARLTAERDRAIRERNVALEEVNLLLDQVSHRAGSLGA